MENIDKYLNHIQEIDPIISSTAIGGTVYFLTLFGILILLASGLNAASKIDKQMTRKLNKMLGRTDLIVRIIPFKNKSNAMTFDGKNIYMTTKLYKELTERERMAILLHESYHIQQFHSLKKTAYMAPFFYLLAYVMTSVSTFGGSLALSLLGVVSLLGLSGIPYNVLFSQKQEMKSDEYAVKFGYGKDLISAFEKWEKEIKKETSSKKCGKICRIIDKLDEFVAEHPTLRKRIENLLKKTRELDKAMQMKSVKKIRDYLIEIF